ncbi:hypothetical protein [Sphingomonas mucosissima]|uniref:Uncharacterized protein n=1 Tax=Sphingomonas mucosissima TaxID=370959 RepID=A0A245ZG00_9SPHN|nr:hypothetical protein [Sphingomonas mucosissima]OWK28665.1 hypothetical protein SPMU_29280 [Sphingomonas mucosissima]
MTNIAILIGAAIVAVASAPVSATRERTDTPAISPRCDTKSCARRVPVTCMINAASSKAGACQHSARDMEELGRQQLDQLIAGLN